MAAKVIDGKAVAAGIREALQGRVRRLFEQHRIVPGLAVILVGDDPASAIYVAKKVNACSAVGGRNHQQAIAPGR